MRNNLLVNVGGGEIGPAATAFGFEVRLPISIAPSVAECVVENNPVLPAF